MSNAGNKQRAALLRSLKQTTQLLIAMLKKRQLRIEIALKSLERSLTLYEKEFEGSNRYRGEFDLAKEFITNMAKINVDQIMYRLLRAIPIMRKNKRYIIDNLKRLKVNSKKKWRIIPSESYFLLDWSGNADRHIRKIISMVESDKLA